MNHRPQDRFRDPETVHSVQLLTANGVRTVGWFDYDPVPLVTGLVFDADWSTITYSNERGDLFRLSLEDGSAARLDLEGFADVHDLMVHEDRMLVANTGYDEIVELTYPDCRVVTRHALAPFRRRGARPDPRAETSESFHCNQGLRAPNGDLLAVVHHCGGYRRTASTSRRLVLHGTGGILNLTTGEVHDLAFHGPHSLRRYGEGWVIADSGHHDLVVLDGELREVRRHKVTGWGRGLAIGGDIAYLGISATILRYARRGDRAKTGVEAVDLTTGESWFVELSSMERTVWVTLCPSNVAQRLEVLDFSGTHIS